MMRKVGFFMAVSALVLGVGCTNMSRREQGTLSGAAIGAAGGAAISALSDGHAGTGALIGGVAGAIAGNLFSRNNQ